MGASKLLHRILKLINYANLCKFIQINEKCYFSILQQILILFVLSDRAWWGLQNFYTEFWNSIIMQIYANLFKINEKCYFSISQRILILFVLSDRAWWGLRNFTELWNSLIMQIYANLFKINEKCHLSSIQKSQQICTSGGDVYYASRNLLSTCYYIHALKQYLNSHLNVFVTINFFSCRGNSTGVTQQYLSYMPRIILIAQILPAELMWSVKTSQREIFYFKW